MRVSQITALPLGEKDRAEFIEVANTVFEEIFEVMEPLSPEETRKLWDAGKYVDNLLQEEMLPISREDALSMIEPFLVGHIAELATQADKNMGLPPLPFPSNDLDSAFASDGRSGLKCDIEINNESGNTHQEILATTAEALRVLATQIEAGRLDDGFHPIKTPDGKTIGEVYLDHYETLTAPNGSFVGRSAKG
jgi:hypothetical protein